GRCHVQRLLAWVEPLGTQRTWAVESAEGLGKLLAQQLVQAGEQGIDVPPADATGSTRAATASSTTRSTWLRSPRSATRPPAGSTTSARSPKGSRRRRHCALWSAASATRSGASSKSPAAAADHTGPGGQPGTTLQSSVAG